MNLQFWGKIQVDTVKLHAVDRSTARDFTVYKSINIQIVDNKMKR